MRVGWTKGAERQLATGQQRGCRVLESDFNVFSAYGSRTSAGVSLLVGRSLDADVDVAILAPKIDKVGRGARRVGRCESSLAGLMTRHDLVDRFRLDHPGREMWTWLDSSPSAKVGSYLDRVLVRRADIDFVSCPTFHLIAC